MLSCNWKPVIAMSTRGVETTTKETIKTARTVKTKRVALAPVNQPLE